MPRAGVGVAPRLPSAFFAMLFTGAAILQFNDPDPGLWVAAYASAAGLAMAAAFGRSHFWPSALLAAIFALWAATLLPALLASESAAFSSFRMQAPSHEESREAVGVLLCAAYAAWLARRCRSRARLNSP